MGRRSSRSRRAANDAKTTYEIDMPFTGQTAKIHLIERDEGMVEVIIANIPTPYAYHTDYNYPDLLEKDEEKFRANATAQWILKDAARTLDQYDWETSSSKSHNPNLYLKDVYFTCTVSKLDDAVLAAKKFLTRLEEKTVAHREEFDTLRTKPSDEFSD